MSNVTCKGKNCEAVDGMNHSGDCIQEHADAINPESGIIRKAIERYCQEVRDPRKGYMVTNAADMMEWLLNYDSTKYPDEPPEIFAGTREALSKLKL